MGKLSSTDGAHLGDTRRQAGAHSDTMAGTQVMVQGLVCTGGLYAIGTKAQLAPRSAGTAAGVLDARSRGQVWTHGCMRGKGWLTHSQVQN